MKTRGRQSSTRLAVVSNKNLPDVIDRPKAPTELTDEQAEEWDGIVDRLPADWFSRENYTLLAQYCRHIVRARRVAQLLDLADSAVEVDIKEYRDLLRAEEEQTRAIASLATKMRLSQQTTYDKSKKKPLERPPL